MPTPTPHLTPCFIVPAFIVHRLNLPHPRYPLLTIHHSLISAATHCASPSFPPQKPAQGAPHCAISPRKRGAKDEKQGLILDLGGVILDLSQNNSKELKRTRSKMQKDGEKFTQKKAPNAQQPRPLLPNGQWEIGNGQSPKCLLNF